MSQDILCRDEKVGELVEQLTVIEVRSKGWQLELNIIKWGDHVPKYDLRPWKENHSNYGKGITLTEDNLKALVKYCTDAQIMDI